MTNENIRKGAVLAVALIAAVISYMHIRHLALAHGQDAVSSALLPLSIDGAVIVATMSMLKADGRWRFLARLLLAAAVGATLAANMAYGAQYGTAGMLIWSWPALAFLGCAELAIGMARHAAPAPAADASPVPVRKPAPAPRVAPAAAAPDDGTDELARHAWLRSAASGEPLSDRKMAERFGNSRTYWTPRIKQWKEASA